MKISEIMTTNVECVSPEMNVTDLARRMKTLDIGFLAICENYRLIGTVTDRDIVIRAIADGRDPSTCTARDVMSKNVIWSFEHDIVKNVAGKMRENEVRRMLILSQERRLAGVVSIGDISKVEEKESGRTLKDITQAA